MLRGFLNLRNLKNLHIDIETYSSVDLKNAGAYKYFDSPDFEIMLMAYAFDNEPVQVLSFPLTLKQSQHLMSWLENPKILKHAHNAAFERRAFIAYGIDTPIDQWRCSAVKSAYCGLPLSLDQVSKALDLGDKAKLESGKSLIQYFTKPCKPTKTNRGRTRNLPEHDLDKWDDFKEYVKQDVEAEREITKRLDKYRITPFEQKLYSLDQKINDYGVLIDKTLATNSYTLDKQFNAEILKEIKSISGLANPNSPAQLKQWLGERTGKEITSLAKNEIPKLIEEAESGEVRRVLELRQLSAKSSVKKYIKMLETTCEDGRAHGLFQFYGASRTGRWAGRLIQLQNLPQNHLKTLDLARNFVRNNDRQALDLVYGNISDTLSQLIRTAFVAPEGYTLAVVDFSAIEARVIAWLAGEKWRLRVFNGHGKIYEASAAMMFNVPEEEVTKGSSLRQKGKIAELALGYQGGVGALKTMGGESMGLDENEMSQIVSKWREANPSIVKFWKRLDNSAKHAVRNPNSKPMHYKGLSFYSDGDNLTIRLPSGRHLFYRKPRIVEKHIKPSGREPFKTQSIEYWGMDQTKKTWSKLDTYGGKLAENIVQAVARDLLAEAMVEADKAGFKLTMHVHDELVAEVKAESANKDLQELEKLMSVAPKWAEGLPLAADGYLTEYYKKD